MDLHKRLTPDETRRMILAGRRVGKSEALRQLAEQCEREGINFYVALRKLL